MKENQQRHILAKQIIKKSYTPLNLKTIVND